MTKSHDAISRLYTVAEVAEVLRAHPKTVRRWIDEGKLVARRPGRKFLIPEQELKHFIRTQWGE